MSIPIATESSEDVQETDIDETIDSLQVYIYSYNTVNVIVACSIATTLYSEYIHYTAIIFSISCSQMTQL